jgi:hypothetical protein
MKRDDTTHAYISPKAPPYVREVLTEALTQAGAHITEVPAAYMDELLMDSLSNKESVEQPSTDESLREIIPLHKHPTLKLAHELIGDLVPHLESMCSSAFIAGGCPRDLYTGLVCKDIDIFTSAISEQNIIGLTIIATQFAQKHNLSIAISEKYDFIGGGILTIKIADCIDLCLTKEVWRSNAQCTMAAVLSAAVPSCTRAANKHSTSLLLSVFGSDACCQLAGKLATPISW